MFINNWCGKKLVRKPPTTAEEYSTWLDLYFNSNNANTIKTLGLLWLINNRPLLRQGNGELCDNVQQHQILQNCSILSDY